MSAAARHRQRARAFEQRENWKRAIEEYEAALEADKLERGRDVDLALYNRIGDLYRRVGNVNRAVHYYELAADGHLAAGFYNNAIALCNKILRNQPNRHSAYLKLGKIGAAKGFLSDARRHFLEYAERMQRSGQLDAAFSALMEFADLSPDPEVRLMIAEQLIEHDRTKNAVEQLRLAWRDLNQEGREADAREVRERILELAPDRDPEVHPPEEESISSTTDAVGVIDLPEILPWGDEPEPEPPPRPEPALADKEPLVDEEVLVDEPALADEPAVGEEPALGEEPAFGDEPLVETPSRDFELDGGLDTDLADIDLGSADLDVEGVDIDADSLQELEQELFGPAPDEPPLDIVPTALVGEEPAEPDFAEEPPSIEFEEPAAAEWIEPAPPVPEEPLDLEPPLEEPVTTPEDRVAELEARLQVEGNQPELLVDLAEALLEIGKRDRATVCLAQSLEGYEKQGRFAEAGRVLDEMLRLDVNDVRAYQKRVELALRAADGPGLVDAYLALADCLDRSDASNKARAVYARVLELDPHNRRAAAALEMFVEEEEAPAAPAPRGQAGGDFVDLRSLVAEEKKKTARKSTRFKIAAADPQSESDVNFHEMLSQFKSKVAEAIEEEDAASHYDLGCAFRDMGLLDEAIAEFQIAARSIDFRLRAIEMLGACFVEKGDHRIALKVLNRALQVSGYRDEELVGIFYAMGRSYEDLGETSDALEWYERVLGCDMNFMDVGRRVSALRT